MSDDKATRWRRPKPAWTRRCARSMTISCTHRTAGRYNGNDAGEQGRYDIAVAYVSRELFEKSEQLMQDRMDMVKKLAHEHT